MTVLGQICRKLHVASAMGSTSVPLAVIDGQEADMLGSASCKTTSAGTMTRKYLRQPGRYVCVASPCGFPSGRKQRSRHGSRMATVRNNRWGKIIDYFWCFF